MEKNCVPVSIQMYIWKVLMSYISQYKCALRMRYLDIAIRLNGCYCHFSIVTATECPHIYVTDKTPIYIYNSQHTTRYLEVNTNTCMNYRETYYNFPGP